jgi:hypothetical protein
MGFFNTEVELIIPPKKQAVKNDKSVKVKSLNGYDAIREKIDEGASPLTAKQPVVTEKPKTKVSIGL